MINRRFITTLALSSVLLAGGLTMPQARAAKGSCNPAPDPYHVREMAKGGGAVTVSVGYGWDGVSVWPNCAGPLVGARVVNPSGQSWYAIFPRAHGNPRVIEFPAGTTRQFTAAQLSAVGLDTLEDINDYDLSPTPNG